MTSRSRPVATPSPFSSSKGNNIEQEQPHLSAGACIRSLVKQLSSSSSAARSKTQHLHIMSSSSTSQDQQQQQGHDELVALKPQVKKQTRKRTHTSRPYQERLLNMAEARREIVTALRIHRANMRQQSSSKYQLEQRQQPRLPHPVVHQVMFQEQSQVFEGVPAVAMSLSYASSSSNSNHLCSSPLANLIAGNYNSSSSMLSYDDLTPIEEEATVAAIGGLDPLACSLPAQPLGLNLSFQGFGGSLDNANKISDDPFGGPLIQSSSCPAGAASSYSAYSSQLTAMPGHGYSSAADAPAALSQALDGEMVYSIGGGERQGLELSEAAANVAAASAWWTKILESMESSGVGESAGASQATCGGEVGMMDDGGLPEWQWLCDGVGVEHEVAAGPKPDILVGTMGLDDGDYSGCYEGNQGGNGGDMALQCMDNEGWDDAEWFS